jgi:hypothetical protein
MGTLQPVLTCAGTSVLGMDAEDERYVLSRLGSYSRNWTDQRVCVFFRLLLNTSRTIRNGTIPSEDQILETQSNSWFSAPFTSIKPRRSDHQSRATATATVPDLIDLTAETSDDDENIDADVEVEIGSVLKNGRLKCRERACGDQSFARQAELRRHFNSKHAPKKRRYWCLVSSCVRSRGTDHRPFHRKDKLMAHVRSMHGGSRRQLEENAGASDQVPRCLI